MAEIGTVIVRHKACDPSLEVNNIWVFLCNFTILLQSKQMYDDHADLI